MYTTLLTQGVIDEKLGKNSSIFTVSHHHSARDAAYSTLLINIETNFTGDDYKCEFTNSRGEKDSHTFKVHANQSSNEFVCETACSFGIVFAVAVFLIIIALLARTIHLNRVRILF